MKFRNALVLGIVLLFAIPAFAQDDQGKFEVSANFSFARWNPAKNVANSVNLYGGGGSLTYFLTQYIGVKAEFLGYGSQNQTIFCAVCGDGGANIVASGNLFTYMFGPVVKKRSGTFQPYGNILLGGAHSNVYANVAAQGGLGASPSSNAFAMAVGGGLDIKLSRSISLRAAEADYLLTRFNAYNGSVNPPFFTTHNQNSFRMLTGIVFTF